jgi:hypothetical protein
MSVSQIIFANNYSYCYKNDKSMPQIKKETVGQADCQNTDKVKIWILLYFKEMFKKEEVMFE